MQRPHLGIIAFAVLLASPVSAEKAGNSGEKSNQQREFIYFSVGELENERQRSNVQRHVRAAARTVCRAHGYSGELKRACVAGTAEDAMNELDRASARLAQRSNRSKKIAIVVAVQ